MKLQLRFLIISLTILALSASNAFKFAYGQEQQLQRLAIVTPSENITLLPVRVGEYKCFYKEEGLLPEILVGPIDASLVRLAPGAADYYYVGPPIFSPNLKMIFFYFDKSPLYLLLHRDVKYIWDLRGKNIATGLPGSNADYTMKFILKHYGLEKDVNIKFKENAYRRFEYLKEGLVDATVLPPPFNVFARLEGFNEFYLGELLPVPSLCLATTNENIRDNLGQVRKMLKIARKSLFYTWEYRDDAVRVLTDLMKEEWEIDEETVYAVYDSLIRGMSRDGSITQQGLEMLAGQAKERLKLQEEIPTQEFLNLSLLEEVQMQQRLMIMPVAVQCIEPYHKSKEWDFKYYLDHDASQVIAAVLTYETQEEIWRDTRHKLLKRSEPYTFTWNGIDQRTGKPAESGKYICRIEVIDNGHTSQEEFSIE